MCYIFLYKSHTPCQCKSKKKILKIARKIWVVKEHTRDWKKFKSITFFILLQKKPRYTVCSWFKKRKRHEYFILQIEEIIGEIKNSHRDI